MLHEYYIELSLVYPNNSKGNLHDFDKTITHKFYYCDFYIIQKSLIIKKHENTHEYDLTDIEKLIIKQLPTFGKERFTP